MLDTLGHSEARFFAIEVLPPPSVYLIYSDRRPDANAKFLLRLLSSVTVVSPPLPPFAHPAPGAGGVFSIPLAAVDASPSPPGKSRGRCRGSASDGALDPVG